jgi:hydroxycarboxylate dehydrogenase B
MEVSVLTFSAQNLSEIADKIFCRLGAPAPIAADVTSSLILSNLLGVDSHGVVRIRNYFDSIKSGAIVPQAEPTIVRENQIAVVMEGKRAFGQVVAKKAMRFALQKAKNAAFGASSFTGVYHIGRLGEFVEMAAAEGFVGLVLANGSRPGGLVAPYGARQRMLGTNPIAFAIPAGSNPPLVADFSTSATSEGRVRIAFRKHEEVPFGLLIDRHGVPTQNPGDLYEGGALCTMGGYKGYALSLLVEVLGGIFSGAETPLFPGYDYMHNGVFMLAIDPTFFRPPSDYRAAVDFLFDSVRKALAADKMEGALIPGDPERRHKLIREKHGIPLDEQTWEEITGVAAELGLELRSSEGYSAPVTPDRH